MWLLNWHCHGNRLSPKTLEGKQLSHHLDFRLWFPKLKENSFTLSQSKCGHLDWNKLPACRYFCSRGPCNSRLWLLGNLSDEWLPFVPCCISRAEHTLCGICSLLLKPHVRLPFPWTSVVNGNQVDGMKANPASSPHNSPFPGFAVSSAPNHPPERASFNQSGLPLPPDCPYSPFLPVLLCSLHLEHILVLIVSNALIFKVLSTYQNQLQIPGLPFSIPWLSKIVHKGLLHTYHWY